MSNFLEKLENPIAMFNVQREKYCEKLFVTDTVPAQSSRLAKIAIGNVGDFRCFYITATYTTLSILGPDIFDRGICSLSMRITDGNNQTLLFNDYIPMDLWASPGRVKSASSMSIATDPPASNFIMPMEFEYLFARNVDILCEVKNTSGTPNTWSIMFHGFRYRQ